MASNIPKNNRIDAMTADQNLIDGFKKHAGAIPSMLIAGETRTAQDIVTTLQSRIDVSKTALSTRATWQTAIRAEESLRDTTRTYVSGVKQALLVAFAGQLDTLADFGLTERAVHVATPEEKFAAAAKSRATRAARHTMGSRQRAAIKGTVPATAPATPTATKGPASGQGT
jgi:hypothetical protein